ncbi:D-alanine--D-alanine ligase [candidate division FCPU426 bacterium]|nr:D-alanine--D-alanine ligase [candidate division FCPU426 bacterium]
MITRKALPGKKDMPRLKTELPFASCREQIGNRKIIVVMGGVSPEREISLLTGQAMLKALQAEKVNVLGVDIRRKTDLLEVVKRRPEVVVNGLHGPGGEDGLLQGMLEWFGIPCTGSGLLASALAMNKNAAKLLMRGAGLPTADWMLHTPGDPIPKRLALPVVVKPNRQGSAIGVSLVRQQKRLAEALAHARQFGEEVVLEKYLPGKEISVGVLQGRALPVIEIVPKKDFYDYEAKYVAGMSEHIIPARLPAGVTRLVQTLAERAAAVLGCKGTPRIDMIISSAGKVNILEVNTLPGMTATSLLPEAARYAGLSFTEVVLRLILDAWERP